MESHDPKDAADVEHLDHVTFLDALRQVSGIAEQGLAMTERADDDVALRKLRHATARQLERVVRRLVVEDFDHQHDAFLARKIGSGHAQIPTQVEGLRDGGDLVDDDGFHCSVPASL